jgi:hypothetical protein
VGASYGNVIVIGSSQEAVANACSRPAFIGSQDGFVLLFCEGDDHLDDPTLGSLSEKLGCVTLNASVQDSDMLAFQLYARGELMTEGVVPDPAMIYGDEFGEEFGEPAPVADPGVLVSILGSGSVEAVEEALSSDEYFMAEDRHRALLLALGLPSAPAMVGYRYLDWEEETGYDGPPLTRLV